MPTANIELRPIHRDILTLIRVVCYEGLPETRIAFVDQNDRHLPRWEPNPHDSRYSIPNGVPEPLVRACLFTVPFNEAEQRWGKDCHDPDPALQYLFDRKLLEVSEGNRPIVAAFENPFNDSEILSTIRSEVNENGRYYVWKTPATEVVLREQDGFLRTCIPYRVLKLTERAHELLDAETVADDAAFRKPRLRLGRKPDTDPKADARIAEAWATGQYKTFADLERELNLQGGEAKRATDRHRKRK